MNFDFTFLIFLRYGYEQMFIVTLPEGKQSKMT